MSATSMNILTLEEQSFSGFDVLFSSIVTLFRANFLVAEDTHPILSPSSTKLPLLESQVVNMLLQVRLLSFRIFLKIHLFRLPTILHNDLVLHAFKLPSEDDSSMLDASIFRIIKQQNGLVKMFLLYQCQTQTSYFLTDELHLLGMHNVDACEFL